MKHSLQTLLQSFICFTHSIRVKHMKQRRAPYPLERPRGVATRMPGHDLAVVQDHGPVDEAP
jgi:hypothetical protein